MNKLFITVDLDWACEPAIEETLDFLKEQNITPTVFITHCSPRVEVAMKELEVGLHPFFDSTSSHGSTVSEVVKHILGLPHNLPAFRCHRFGVCNSSRQAMAEAGMVISSNVCTDLEVVPPFRDRFGLLEVPIFLEDGGYLWRNHSLKMTPVLRTRVLGSGAKIVIIHPMHFALNTPHFSYMYDIKKTLNRMEWNNMTEQTLKKLRWKGRGIRDLITDLLQLGSPTGSLGSFLINTP
ncbi:hypothetical protein [Candidatus Paracaedibacter symbiosus]|uniref:polysaccharide deacetylase WbmS family protein n=1 Tax=Candidatus Paracaedibacter symbiosus TaxID=244582 RepID=UPI00068D5362|nr:hypothetical protein [Candidatus Paracaedibacter symbiosus]